MQRDKFDKAAERFVRHIDKEQPSVTQVSALLGCLILRMSDEDQEFMESQIVGAAASFS
jgi:hypothetical protein